MSSSFSTKMLVKLLNRPQRILMTKSKSSKQRTQIKTKYIFKGTFNDSCQQESVPQTLISLVRMILGGPSMDTDSSNIVETQTMLTISQLLQFNCAIRRQKDADEIYQSSDREPQLPIYL